MTSVRAGSLPSRRPKCVEDSHLEFLDALEARETVSLWEARRYVVAEFSTTDYIAGRIVSHWQRSRKRRVGA